MGMIFDICRESYVDGPGIRTAVFFKGCNLRCLWCHNPESQSFEKELLFYENKCISCGKCAEKCTHTPCIKCGECALYCPRDARRLCGEEATAEEIAQAVAEGKPYYGTEGGVTFSGGECMLQLDFLEDCLRKCKDMGIRTAVDTAGHVPYDAFARILPYTDLFLYDLKAMDSRLHKTLTGVGNELILENLRRLADDGARIWVRIPVIENVNTHQLPAMAELLHSLPIEKTELLPYHAMGEGKYAALGRETPRFLTPDASSMERYRSFFA